MKRNISADFRICISAPLKEKHLKTIQKQNKNKKRSVCVYLKVSLLMNIYRENDSCILSRFLVWTSQPALFWPLRILHD